MGTAHDRKGDTGMAPVVTMRQLLESGVHFGHQTRRWNPKMKRFIFAERNGIYIIDLQQSLDFIDRAYEFIKETVAHGGTVLYVGTKKQAQEAIAEQARRVGMPFVNQRWLGGMLTNFSTVYKRLQRLKELDEIDFEDVAASGMTKKELLHLRRERDKLDRSLGGIKDMARTPSALWVVDTKKEHIAVSEARKLGIPVIAILDTNCDPDEVTYPIPGNDDAIRSVSLLTRVVADAVADGLMARAGAANGEDKPATPRESGELGAEEPLAEWERELLEHKASAAGAAPETAAGEAATADAAAGDAPGAEATAGDAPGAEATAGDAPGAEATAGDAPGAEATAGDAPGAEATAGDAAGAEATAGDAAGAEATASAAAGADATASNGAGADATASNGAGADATADDAAGADATASNGAGADATASNGAGADATVGDAAGAGPEAPAGEAAAEQAGDAGDAAPDAAQDGTPGAA
jgi:small subunit ribosomal protein S2